MCFVVVLRAKLSKLSSVCVLCAYSTDTKIVKETEAAAVGAEKSTFDLVCLHKSNRGNQRTAKKLWK